MKSKPPLPDHLAPYAGRWVALVRGRVAGSGLTPDEARVAARHTRPKEKPELIFVPCPTAHVTQVPLPEHPLAVVRQVAARQGTRLWPVGGCIRDALLERPFHDWDLVVQGNAMELARRVANALDGAYVALHDAFDTARVVLDSRSAQRLELDFAGLRGPDLNSDLALRDFTINAMAVGPQGELLDPLGGYADLAARSVRATHADAFRDDPLRLLRAVRVAAELGERGFAIEPQTLAWMRRDAPLLARSALERVRDEFARIVAAGAAAEHLALMDEVGLLCQVVPELDALHGVTQPNPPHRFDAWRHTLGVVATLEHILAILTRPGGPAGIPAYVDAPGWVWELIAERLGRFGERLREHLETPVSSGRTRRLALKLAAVLHDVAKPCTWSQDEEGRIHFYEHEHLGTGMAEVRLRALRFSNDEVERVSAIVDGHMRPAHLSYADSVSARAVHRYFRTLGDAGVEVALLALADYLGKGNPNLQLERRLAAVETLLSHYFERHEQTIAPRPLVDGREILAALGQKRGGPWLGEIVAALQEAQAAGEVATREEALALARLLWAESQSTGSKGS